MKKLILILTLTALLAFLLIFMPKLLSQQIKAKDYSDFQYAPGKIVIQFSKEVSPVIPMKIIGIIQTGIASVDELCLTFKVHTMRRQFPNPKYSTPDLTRHFVVKFDKSINLDQVVNAFSKIPFIEKAEKVGLHKFDSEPNDDNYPQQWHLNQISDCDIDAPEAWDIQKGNDSVILAVVDSGVRYTHPDLNNNIWINPGETGLDQWGFPKETNNRDDDNNGYIDDVHGWNFIDNDNDPSDLSWQDNSDNEEKFIIERKSGPNWYPLDYVGPNITTYWDIDLWCGMLWCYRLRAYNQAGYSPYSNTACTKTTSCYYCDPWGMKIIPDKKIINSGESVTYTYELKNKGNVDLIDIELIDYEFGIIATKFTLKKGETRNFTKTVTLTETTTNFAEATAKYHHEGRIVSVKTNAQAIVEVRK